MIVSLIILLTLLVLVVLLTSFVKVSPNFDEVVIIFDPKQPRHTTILTKGESTYIIPFKQKIATMKLSPIFCSNDYYGIEHHTVHWKCSYRPDDSNIFALNKAAATFTCYTSEEIQQMIESAVNQSLQNSASLLGEIEFTRRYETFASAEIDQILTSGYRRILSEIGYTGAVTAIIAPRA